MEKLIFVYNAESGKLNAFMYSLHKLVNPSIYSCKLCALTLGSFQEKKAWKDFREKLDVETEFLHKDKFQKLYASKFGHKFEFPIILSQTKNGLEILIYNKEFSEINNLEILMDMIRERMKNYG